MSPGPQAVGQVLGVQNSDKALENRLMCLKNATAEEVKKRVITKKGQEVKSQTYVQLKTSLTVAGEPLCLVDTRWQRG